MKNVKTCLKKQTTIDAVVLHRLMDGKLHTRQDLADRTEVTIRTIQRCLDRLSSHFIIHSILGCRGGVYLDECYIYYGLTKD